jgi:hypothetical protein
MLMKPSHVALDRGGGGHGDGRARRLTQPTLHQFIELERRMGVDEPVCHHA